MGQPITELVDGMIDIINRNLIAKSNLISNALTGEILINVENSYHFVDGQEIILIDYGYNDVSSPHYNKYEYAVVKEVNNTFWITLEQPIQDPDGGWMVSDKAFIQKTIGHSPLYTDRIYYGDREVIPTEEMAITVEPVSLSNEWIYIQGGLSKEYRMAINVYGKDIETEEGMRILNKYTDALYDLFMGTLHINIKPYYVPILANITAGTSYVYVEDNSDNREELVATPTNFLTDYLIQDNLHVEHDFAIIAVSPTVPDGSGVMRLTLSRVKGVSANFQYDYSTLQYAVLIKYKRYFYDSRVDGIEYGVVQKGSAFIRAARLNWFGKEVEEHVFPQHDLSLDYFENVELNSSTSESSSSSS